jgi:Peptidase family M23
VDEPRVEERPSDARSESTPGESTHWVRPGLDLRLVALPPAPAPERSWHPQPAPHVEAAPVWFHPLAGPSRALPLNGSRRFGAARPTPRPAECELGHCGVDLGTTAGVPVFAVFDGVIERIERDETKATSGADARAGRFVRIGHKDGTVVSRYIHLDSIRADLSEGDRVKGGELIGRLGSTGIFSTGPHLHFSLSLRDGGRGTPERYIDPEPLLRLWQLPLPLEERAPDRTAVASRAPIWPAQVSAPAATLTRALPVVSAPVSSAPVVPAARAEVRWERAHWAWNGARWIWIAAAWRSPAPREAQAWIPPHWVWNGAGWIWAAGAWRSPPAHWAWNGAGWIWVAARAPSSYP